MSWYPDKQDEPQYGSVNGEHDVYFKVSDNGETLIADEKYGTERFNSTGTPGTFDYQVGQHDHYGNETARTTTAPPGATTVGLAPD